jgi:hypothetical protein
MTNTSENRCELCGRVVKKLDRHHLIPRTRHANRRNKKRFDRQEVRDRLAMVCKPCHKTIHAVLSEKELENDYNTLDALRAHPQIARFIAWLRRQPAAKHVTVRWTNDRRRRKRRR